MSDIPAELLYTKSHEWVRKEADGTVVIGITDHAQEALGDMVFVDLPEVGDEIEAGGDLAVVESVKAASDVYAPVSGNITEVNTALADAPEMINTDSYGDGWFLRLATTDTAGLDALLSAADYAEVLADEA